MGIAVGLRVGSIAGRGACRRDEEVRPQEDVAGWGVCPVSELEHADKTADGQWNRSVAAGASTCPVSDWRHRGTENCCPPVWPLLLVGQRPEKQPQKRLVAHCRAWSATMGPGRVAATFC